MRATLVMAIVWCGVDICDGCGVSWMQLHGEGAIGYGRLVTVLPNHGEAYITSSERKIVHYVNSIFIPARQNKASNREDIRRSHVLMSMMS